MVESHLKTTPNDALSANIAFFLRKKSFFEVLALFQKIEKMVFRFWGMYIWFHSRCELREFMAISHSTSLIHSRSVAERAKRAERNGVALRCVSNSMLKH